MGQSASQPDDGELLKALALLAKALEILDAVDAPSNIGAHVDLAISLLREVLEAGNPRE